MCTITNQEFIHLCNCNDKIYIILEKHVYNITNFKHSGGDFIKIYNGKDITTIFYNVNHGKVHIKILEKYKIGKLLDDQI